MRKQPNNDQFLSPKLSLDYPTRWDFTYKVLDIVISYKDVFVP